MKYLPASLALGGGGLKGVAHIGILQVFEEEGFPIEYISGSSAGALLGALYAVGYSTEDLLRIANEYAEEQPLDFRIRPWIALVIFIKSVANWLKICDQSTPRGLVDGKQIDRYLAQLFGNAGFDDLRYPLIVPAVDLQSGRLKVFTSHELAKKLAGVHDIDCCIGEKLVTALRASTAIPGIMPPLSTKYGTLVDGGVKDKVPADLLRFAGAKRVIAIDVGASTDQNQKFDTMLEILLQTIEVMGNEMTDLVIERYSDLLIKPPLGKIALTDSHRLQEIYDIGYRTGKRKVRAIRSLLKI